MTPNEEERKGGKEGREVDVEVFLTAMQFYGRLGKAVKEPLVALPRSVIGCEQPWQQLMDVKEQQLGPFVNSALCR